MHLIGILLQSYYSHNLINSINKHFSCQGPLIYTCAETCTCTVQLIRKEWKQKGRLWLGSWHRSLTFLLSPMTDFPIMLRRERRSDRCQGCRQCCRLYWAWLMHTSRKRHVWLHHGFPTLSTLPWFFSRWKTKRLSLFLAIKDLCSCIARCK